MKKNFNFFGDAVENAEIVVLAERIARGDREAENELFVRCSEPIRMMVRVRLRQVVSHETYQDIVAEVYKAVLISLRKGGFDPKRGISLMAYIAGISGHVVSQHFRRAGVGGSILKDDIESLVDNEQHPIAGLIDEDRRKKLLAYLRQLPEKYAHVLHLRYYEQLSIAEIADKLQIERRRVSERIHYALKKLSFLCMGDEDL